MWETVLTALIASIGSSGILTWWFKKRIEHRYETELENHKANLKHDYDVQVEKMKAELARQHFQYSHVFQKTEEIIAETYKNLLSMKAALERYTLLARHDEELKAKLLKEFWENVNGFKAYFEPVKIYIPKTTVRQIEGFTINVTGAWIQFNQAMGESKLPNRKLESYGHIFDDFFKTSNGLPKLLELLEDDFQHLLGFSISK